MNPEETYQETEARLKAEARNTPEGRLLVRAGFEPWDTESSARIVARHAAREIEELRAALERIVCHGPIMGSTGDYRQGQLDILETVSTIAGLALAETKGTT